MKHVQNPQSLLIVTPFSTPNYAYPGAAYLARYLKQKERLCDQADLSLETLLLLFSQDGLQRLFEVAEPKKSLLSPWNQRVVAMRDRYLETIDNVIPYLQGRDPAIAYRLVQRGFLPRGENFAGNRGFDWYDGAGNNLPLHDRAIFVCTLYLYDIAGLVREAVFSYFQITMVDRQYDDFVHHCATFDRMRLELERQPNLLDELLYEALDKQLARVRPDIIGVSVPFARNLYYSLRIGKRFKEFNPNGKVAAGGGLFNTSMREPNEPRLFDYIDFLCLDDGEAPMLNIVEYVEGSRPISELKRTWYRDPDGQITYSNGSKDSDASHEDAGAPDYSGYRLNRYYSTLETTNLNQRVRTDGWWNKLTMAHGCYWKKCSFCDIHLSYIADYDPASERNLVDKVEQIVAQTGQTGFHFVDEALPPKGMRHFALELVRRNLDITWHGMMRFDKVFTPEFCKLLARSGLVAIFGGLEVASNRLLKLMKKGTTVEQVAVVAKNFQEAGIKVHAYIMYGFPSQTAQETIDALDVVRQLFHHGLLTSASWAQFGVTPHSPIGRNPEEYGISLRPIPGDSFIQQIIAHDDPANDHERFDKGLNTALRFFAMGMHTDKSVDGWFDFPVPKTTVDPNLMANVLKQRARKLAKPPSRIHRDKRLVWLGPAPSVRSLPMMPGTAPMAELVLHGVDEDHTLPMPKGQAEWLARMLKQARPCENGPILLNYLEASYEIAGLNGKTYPVSHEASFEGFMLSPAWLTLCQHGLIAENVVRWTGEVPKLRLLPYMGTPARAELVVENGAGPVALPLPARRAAWLAETLEKTRLEPQPLDAIKRSFASAHKVNGYSSPLSDLYVSETWRTLCDRGLAVL